MACFAQLSLFAHPLFCFCTQDICRAGHLHSSACLLDSSYTSLTTTSSSCAQIITRLAATAADAAADVAAAAAAAAALMSMHKQEQRCCREPHLLQQKLQQMQKLLRSLPLIESKQLLSPLPLQYHRCKQMLPILTRLLSNTLVLITVLTQTSVAGLHLLQLPPLALHQTGRNVH